MIRRSYQCLDCGDAFEVSCEANDDDFPCPYCEKVMEWRPGMFAIGTNKGKAVDIAQSVMEQDYGLSDIKDARHEGEVAYKEPVKTTAQTEAENQQISEIIQQRAVEAPKPPPGMENAVKGFWGGANGGGGPSPMVMQSLMAAAKTGPAADVNPMALLHEAGRSGKLPTNYRIIARDKG